MKTYYRMKASKDAGGNWRPDANGKWNYVPLPDGVGKPPKWVLDAEANGGPFYLRPGGEKYPSREAARKAANAADAAATAEKHGVAVEESDTSRNSIRNAVERYLERKAKKAPKTVAQYTFQLEEFIEWLPRTVRYIDQIDSNLLLKFQRHLEDVRNQSPKTVHNKLLTVCFMLKFVGVENPSRMVEFPTIEEEIPEPYSPEDLAKLFAAMENFYGKGKQHEDIDAFKFFLASACREQEVAHATWLDIDWRKATYTVRAKTWDAPDGTTGKFAPKNHERRSIPLTDEVMVLLKARKAESNSPWIFPNTEGQPEGHFLRSFKRIARKAGLNCGKCESKRNSEVIKHACAEPQGECHDHYLHRLRKSRATFWNEQRDISIRTIQYRLGHKSLETTQKYLGIQSSERTREADNRPMYHVA